MHMYSSASCFVPILVQIRENCRRSCVNKSVTDRRTDGRTDRVKQYVSLLYTWGDINIYDHKKEEQIVHNTMLFEGMHFKYIYLQLSCIAYIYHYRLASARRLYVFGV
jgi:hypothetical protein